MVLFFKKQPEVPRRRQVNSNESKNSGMKIGAFYRNRTLSSIKAETDSSRGSIHHLSMKRTKLVKILAVTSGIIILLFIFISNFTASVDVVFTNNDISSQIKIVDYRNSIQNYLNMYPLSRFKVFVDQNRLNKYMQEQIPEIAEITQSDDFGIGKTNYVITLRKPVASWKIDDKKYFVDSNGVAFENNHFSASVLEVIDNSGVRLQTGSASISKRFLGFVGLIVSLSKDRGYEITEAILPPNTTRQLEIKTKDSELVIKMTIDRSAGEQVEDMDRAVKYFKSLNQTPTYIDVRVGGKAFYK